MKTSEIMAGVVSATTIEELITHRDSVEKAASRGECDFTMQEWRPIGALIQSKADQFLGLVDK